MTSPIVSKIRTKDKKVMSSFPETYSLFFLFGLVILVSSKICYQLKISGRRAIKQPITVTKEKTRTIFSSDQPHISK